MNYWFLQPPTVGTSIVVIVQNISSHWPRNYLHLSSGYDLKSRAIKLRQSGSRRDPRVFFLQFTCYQLSLHISFYNRMSLSTPSTTMFRRALLSSRLATPVECSARTIRPAFARYRYVSSAARLPTITASETRRRPTVRPHQQPASQGGVNGLSPTSKRTIFIQTENTPNPDVSSRAQLSDLYKRTRTYLSFLTI